MARDLTPRQEAKRAGLPAYFGKPCRYHPELAGERFVSNCHCTGCAALSNGSAEQYRRDERKLAAPDRFRGEICRKHPRRRGLRYRANGVCVGCLRDANAVERRCRSEP